MPHAFEVGRAAQRLGLVLAGAAVLCGCADLSSAVRGTTVDSDPEDQLLEIVVGNPDPEYGPCLLNVDEVGAGTHEVVSMSMGGDATVRILDPSGAVVFEQVVEEDAGDGGHEVLEGDQGSVRLAAGDHRVECVLSDGTSTADLLVVPARPGHEEGGAG